MSRPDAAMDSGITLEEGRGPDGRTELRLAGRLDTLTAGSVWQRGLETIRAAGGQKLRLEGSRIEYCDSGGATMITTWAEAARDGGGELSIENFPARFEPLLELVRFDTPVASPPERSGFIVTIGRLTFDQLADFRVLLTYVGQVTLAIGWAILHPLRVRWADTFRAMQSSGVMAFPVIFLVNFLVGLILAYQTAPIFIEYGAEIYLVDMLGIAITRELGPLMCAIILTARSGSAFAAEIGTMRVNEEVDALTTMGLDPVRFLMIPRILSAVVMTPLLTIFANTAGILGGLVVWVTNLDYPRTTYTDQLLKAVSLEDLLGGLFKALFFGILVAAIGCIRGMQTRGGATAVGISTTRAVVSGIVFIVLADALFGIVYFSLGI